MMNLSLIDILFLYSLISIWLLLVLNIVLTYFGYLYQNELNSTDIDLERDIRDYPFVSILIPAHNEGKVIGHTVKAMLELDYPNDRYEIIVINDNSNDNTESEIEKVLDHYIDREIIVINNKQTTGPKGKSNALNVGLKRAVGEFVVVYDADNTPNNQALKYLVYGITRNGKYGAVIGKFRTRNKERNTLTRFINIETLSFQWMAQAGRWKLFRLCTIPGTNFIIRKSILEKLGGWDVRAIAEDTEISFRIYALGYKISFMPFAVTYEQEPETLKVWFKQRTRWVSGNIYVMIKFIRYSLKERQFNILFDLFYFFSVYILFLSSIIVSDTIFILGLFTDVSVSLNGNYLVVWLLTYIIFVLQITIALSMEKGEVNNKNLRLILIMYFTYCQLWLIVSIKGMYTNIKSRFLGKETKWYKTERF
ncbi:MAG: glycosyltransferase [Firmicutes bacterium]|nr:glycosyltransferase [Bacillota bacterium]